MKPTTITPELFRLPGDIVLILAGVVPALLAAVTAWRFRNESAGAADHLAMHKGSALKKLESKP